MNILIVDDIATNRKLLKVTLEAEGHTTVQAADGVEALQVLAHETVDAVISDILMPNMDGFRLCLEVRKSERFHALPFIVYTSTYTSPDDVKLAQTVGADKYLTKPAPAADILNALREVMHTSAARPVLSAPAVEETYVLQQYSQTLVNKLEEKNTELNDALDKLQRAHERIVVLNSNLERRVQERTAELETANRELSHALSEVKQLNALLPICSYCKKIRDDNDYWQSVEGYISQHTNAHFTHGICPECLQTELKIIRAGNGHRQG
ncbi:MAG: Response regulator receiver protein [Verrucomicrobiales bacterium]|nr:Response regulator receiver protein [Verrucomicrobiales bacterium]